MNDKRLIEIRESSVAGSLKDYDIRLELLQYIDRLSQECAVYREALAYFDKKYDLDCGDNSCMFAKKKGGMRTNGGCHCAEGFFDDRISRKMAFNIFVMHRQALAKGEEIRSGK